MQKGSNTMQDTLTQDYSTYKFYRQETAEWESVKEEEWKWIALYNDGTSLEQFDEHGIFHQIKEIDQSKLQVFKMVSRIHTNAYVVLFDPAHHELIHLYRKFGFDFTGKTQRAQFYVFGYKTNGNPSIKVLNVITPSGELIITDDLDKITLE